MNRKCKVCGARITHAHIQTCDGICGRASKHARTRPEQFKIEMQLEAEWESFVDISPEYSDGDLELANRPYLMAAFA